jgi:hypothetical protein
MGPKAKPVLSDHSRKGKRLMPALAALNLSLMDWEGEYLPEHLWLAYIMRGRTVGQAAAVFNAACDVIDESFVPVQAGHVFLGYVSDFCHVRQTQTVIERLNSSSLACLAIGDDFRRALDVYPVSPMSWLALPGDADESKELVRDLIRLLSEQKAGVAAQARILPLNRLLKHELIFFTRDVVDDELALGLASYPNVDSEMASRVEQFVRLALNVTLASWPRTGWPVGFWMTGFSLAKCP